MRKILFLTNIISGTGLAIHVARENPDIRVDLIGPAHNQTSIENLSWITEIYNSETALDWLKNNHSQYDFIYCADHLMQSHRDFHAWRLSISTPILCPDSGSYQMEYSKLYTKDMLSKIDVPGPEYEIITETDLSGYERFISQDNRCVFKIDSTKMSFGYQTRIVDRSEDFQKILASYRGWTDSMFVEQYIPGSELSYHILVNGRDFVFLGAARDFKKIYEGDQGKNCGSAGCYSPVEFMDNAMMSTIDSYSRKIIDYLCSQNIDYRGIMYIGIKIAEDGEIFVLEINTRPGNPEFIAILQTIRSKNILKNLIAAAQGNDLESLEFSNEPSVSINLINCDYTPYYKDSDLPVLAQNENLQMIYFDPREFFNNYYCNVTTRDVTIKSASRKISSYLDVQQIKNYRYRKDIHD